jgi:uncharacterized protein involved in exopolysaccharide biosynthesis
MDDTGLVKPGSGPPAPLYPVREVIAVAFRWRTRIMVVFATAFVLALIAAFSLLWVFVSEMKILVKTEGVDALIPSGPAQQLTEDAVETQVNSEIELLRDEEVLERTVAASGLSARTREPFWLRLSPLRYSSSSAEGRRARAIRAIRRDLEIRAPKKTSVISIAYRSRDPQIAAEVLKALSKTYLEKHAQIHRPPGEFEFFDAQVSQYQEKLRAAEAALAAFPKQGGTAAPELERELAVRRLNDVNFDREQTEANIRATRQRIANLETQAASTPERVTTTVRMFANPELVQQLKVKLMNLELQRTELLQRYDPSYRAIRDVEEEIARVRQFSERESAPLQDQTTDRDATHEWIVSELAKARAELSSLETRAVSQAQSARQYDETSRRMNSSSLHQHDLLRTAKILEDTYQLYVVKREEARMREAVDRSKLANVAIIQAPAVPALPAHSPWVLMLGSLLFAAVMSIVTAIGSESLDNSFRTPYEVESYLEIPVLAALPPAQHEGTIAFHGGADA